MIKPILASMSLLMSLSASAEGMKCQEILERTTTEVLRAQYSVKVTHLAEITNSPAYSHLDHAWKVRVDLLQAVGRNVVIKKSFEAVATSYDVQYQISAVKAQGFSFNAYLDELNESSMTLTDANGTKKRISLNCGY